MKQCQFFTLSTQEKQALFVRSFGYLLVQKLLNYSQCGLSIKESKSPSLTVLWAFKPKDYESYQSYCTVSLLVRDWVDDVVFLLKD